MAQKYGDILRTLRPLGIAHKFVYRTEKNTDGIIDLQDLTIRALRGTRKL